MGVAAEPTVAKIQTPEVTAEVRSRKEISRLGNLEKPYKISPLIDLNPKFASTFYDKLAATQLEVAISCAEQSAGSRPD